MRMNPAAYRRVCLAVAAVVSATAASAQSPPPADLIVTGARIYTVDAAHPMAEALAVRGTRLVFVGSASEAQVFRGPSTRLVDVHGSTIIPGMVDAHAHLLDAGQTLQQVDLSGAATYEEVIARVAARARTAAPGTWIRGWGWDQNRWPGQRFPTQETLSAAVPAIRCCWTAWMVTRCWPTRAPCSWPAFTRETRDPPGGRVLHDAAGNPTGVFVDNAEGLIGACGPGADGRGARSGDPRSRGGVEPLGPDRSARSGGAAPTHCACTSGSPGTGVSRFATIR